jgi:hypothetical protein
MSPALVSLSRDRSSHLAQPQNAIRPSVWGDPMFSRRRIDLASSLASGISGSEFTTILTLFLALEFRREFMLAGNTSTWLKSCVNITGYVRFGQRHCSFTEISQYHVEDERGTLQDSGYFLLNMLIPHYIS